MMALIYQAILTLFILILLDPLKTLQMSSSLQLAHFLTEARFFFN